MSFENDKDADPQRRSHQASAAEVRQKNLQKKKKGPASNEVGSALRSIYQRTIDEQIPPDLLDLLGKLG